MGRCCPGDYAYIIGNVYLFVIDISNLADPEIVGQVYVKGGGTTIATNGGYAYVCTSGGLLVLDISNPTTPVLTGGVAAPGLAADLAIDGEIAHGSRRLR